MDRLSEQQTKMHHARVIKYYDIAQRFYDKFWHKESLGLHYGFWEDGVQNRQQAILKENEFLADKAGVQFGEVVLDAGCGIGGSGIWLAENRGARVYGLNLVNSQLLRAHELAIERGLIPSLGYVQGDYQRLPVRDSSIDVFWALESIEHATNPGEMIEEAYRTLKPGGRIGIAGTFRGRDILTVQELEQLDVGMKVAGCFNDLRTTNHLEQVMGNIGFSDIQNLRKTPDVMESARQMTRMCRLGLPVARVLARLHLVSPILVLNNEWGTYQEELFRSGATSYNVIVALKA